MSNSILISVVGREAEIGEVGLRRIGQEAGYLQLCGDAARVID